MRNADKVLIVPLAHASLLLPERILSNNDRSYPLLYQKVNHALAGSVQVVVHLPVTRVGNPLHLPGDALALCFGKAQLEFFHALVVPLVHGFERSTVNQSRNKALSVCCYRRYIRDAKINGNAERGINVGLYWLLAVNDFYDIV